MSPAARAEPTGRASARAGLAERASSLLRLSLRRFSALWLFAIFFVTFTIARPEIFPTAATARLVLSGQVTVGLLAFAVLVPLAAGVFDLSVGAMLAFSAIIFTFIQQQYGWNSFPTALLAIACCTVVGVVNGLIVVRFSVDSFIATLGTSQVLLASMLLISKNRQISGVFSEGFLQFTQGRFLGLTLDVYYLVVIALLLWFVLEHTPVGRYLYAVGGNREAARLAGVNTERVIRGSLVASATIAGFAGIIFSSQVGLFSTSFGPPLLFPAFAAVFFGATQIKNRPNVWGTLLALYALAFGVQGLQLVFFDGGYWITPLFNGIALVVAVAFASYRKAGPSLRRRRRDAQRTAGGSSPGGVPAPRAEKSAPAGQTRAGTSP